MAKLKGRRLVGLLITAILVVGAGIGPGEAASITPVSGDLEVNLIVDIATITILAFDVRGTHSFLVSDPGPVGFVLATDLFDLVTPAPFPNAALRVINSAFDQNIILAFDAGSVVVPGPLLTVEATGFPIGAVTDPALSAFLGPLLFSFLFDPLESAIDVSAGLAFFNFDLVAVTQVSGAASLTLLVLGAVVSGLGRFRRRR